jgi:hypothetical protein
LIAGVRMDSVVEADVEYVSARVARRLLAPAVLCDLAVTSI